MAPPRSRTRYLAPASALAGAGLLAWLLVRTGPAQLLELWTAVRPILPVVVTLTALRYVLQAAGWCLATRATERPGWGPTVAGVIAGEAAGYVAGGMVAREPVKLLFVRDRVPPRVAFSGAAVERLASASAGAALILTAGTIAAFGRAPRAVTSAFAAAFLVSVTLARRNPRARPRAESRLAGASRSPIQKALASATEIAVDLWRNRRSALAAIGVLALAQEAVNVSEAYLLLTRLGAAPALATVIVFEAANRAANIVGQFVPGRMGVSEATGALAAGTLQLNPIYGLSLALTRRARSLLWAIVGLLLLVLRNVIKTSARSPGGERPDTLAASV